MTAVDPIITYSIGALGASGAFRFGVTAVKIFVKDVLPLFKKASDGSNRGVGTIMQPCAMHADQVEALTRIDERTEQIGIRIGERVEQIGVRIDEKTSQIEKAIDKMDQTFSHLFDELYNRMRESEKVTAVLGERVGHLERRKAA
jgi:division protein CdvB (Snf7/Vps24/ESCRT-III family)